MAASSQRVFLVTGPWHLVTLSASLGMERRGGQARGGVRDHLVAWGRAEQEPLRTSMLGVASALHRWASVSDVGTSFDVPSAAHLGALADRLRAMGLPGHPDELWIPAFWPHTTKVAAAVWERADVVLFEEGLLTYSLFRRFRMLPFLRSTMARALRGVPPGNGFRGLGSVLAHHLADRRNLWWEEGAPRSMLRRTKRDYRLLRGLFGTQPDFPPWIERIDVPRELVLDRLAVLRQALAWHPPPRTDLRGRALFLPQNLSAGGWMEESKEVAIYVEAIGRLLASGREVLWKEHPRATPRLYPRIAAALPGRVEEIRVEACMPVEAIASDLGVDLCCGIYTMSLAYLPYLHGIETACIADECLPHVRGHDELVRGLTLMGGVVPSLDAVLARTDASALARAARTTDGAGG